MNEEMTDLMHKHLNNTLSAAEAATLANAMLEDPGLADHFASLTRLDADLTAAMKDGERTALYTRRMERAAEEVEPAPARKRWPVKTMAAAAGFAVLMGAGWSLFDGLNNRSSARKGKPGQPGTGGTSAGFASTTGMSREAESSAMKKKLRRFYVPVMSAKSQPVSSVLAQLQTRWRDASGKEDREAAAVTFAVADKLRQRWVKPEDEPAVTLEIPGISMLANLELVAAQAGLKPVITSQGVTMEEDLRPAGKERTWTIPLPKASLTAFIRKSSQETARARNDYDSLVRLSFTSNADNSWWKRLSTGTADPQELALRTWIEGTGNASQEFTAEKMLGAVAAGQPQLTEFSGRSFRTWSALSGEEVPSGAASASVNLLEAGEVTAPNFITGAGIKPNAIDSLIMAEAVKSELATGQPPPQEFAASADLPESGGVAAPDDGIKPNSIDSLIMTEGVKSELDVVFISKSASEDVASQLAAAFSPDGGTITTQFLSKEWVATSPAADPSAALVRLLAAHGIPEECLTYDAETGILTARGSMQNLRAANVAAAAIAESSSDGVSAEMKMIEWKDGPPPSSGAAPGTAVWLTSGEVQALLKLPNAGVRGGGRSSARIGDGLLIDHSLPAKEAETAVSKPSAGLTLSLSGTRHLAGDSISMRVEVAVAGAEPPEKQSVPVSMSADGGWLRFDFPAAGDRKAVTALVRLLAASVDP